MKKIMDKIRKLLALSESSNVHEAAAAMRQARKLMDKYQLTSADSEVFRTGSATVSTKNVKHPKWEIDLAAMIGQAFQCSVYTGWAQVRFVGAQGNPEVASYTYDVLYRQLNIAKSHFISEYQGALPATKRKMGRAFAEAWVAGVWKNVSEFAAPLSAQATKVHDEYLRTAEQVRTKEGRAKKSSISSDPVALAAAKLGYSQGQDVQLHYGVGAAEGPGRLSHQAGAA